MPHPEHRAHVELEQAVRLTLGVERTHPVDGVRLHATPRAHGAPHRVRAGDQGGARVLVGRLEGSDLHRPPVTYWTRSARSAETSDASVRDRLTSPRSNSLRA